MAEKTESGAVAPAAGESIPDYADAPEWGPLPDSDGLPNVRVEDLSDAARADVEAAVADRAASTGSAAVAESLRLEEAERHTGAMVALYPSGRDAAKLALDGGEPVDELHVTLGFLGKAAKLKDPARLKQIVAGVAAASEPLWGEVSGVGMFEKGPKPVTYLSIDAPGLEVLRQALADALTGGGFPPDGTHGFTPHLTLAYADRRDEARVPSGRLRFDAVALVLAGARTEFPLGKGK